MYCKFYPQCLALFARLGKYRFSCVSCRRYSPLFVEPEDTAEDRVACLKFLHELFFGVDPYPRGDGMRRKIPEQEMVTVPAHLVKGFIYSLNQGVEYLQASLNIAGKLNDILKKGDQNGQRPTELEAVEAKPGGKDL